MISIAICDDEEPILSFIKEKLLDCLNKNNMRASISLFSESKKMLLATKSRHFDIIFLDISMPGFSGFDIADHLRGDSYDTYIVFISSRTDLIHQSMNFQPYNFIVKDTPQQMEAEINRITSLLLHHFRQFKVIKVDDCMNGATPVVLKNIKYIKSRGHYLEYYLQNDAAESLCERKSISAAADELLDCGFVRVQKQYIVNMTNIKKFDALIDTIVLTSGEKIPISRMYKTDATDAYNKFRRH